MGGDGGADEDSDSVVVVLEYICQASEDFVQGFWTLSL
jgi:hypothetical protein